MNFAKSRNKILLKLFLSTVSVNNKYFSKVFIVDRKALQVVVVN